MTASLKQASPASSAARSSPAAVNTASAQSATAATAQRDSPLPSAKPSASLQHRRSANPVRSSPCVHSTPAALQPPTISLRVFPVLRKFSKHASPRVLRLSRNSPARWKSRRTAKRPKQLFPARTAKSRSISFRSAQSARLKPAISLKRATL